MHVVGGMPIMIIGISTLGMLYFGFSFYFFSEKKLANQNIALTIPSGIIFSITLFGILYKLQYWPGHGYYNLFFGFIACPGILVATYFLEKNSVDDMAVYYKRMMRRAIAFSLLSAVFFFTSSETILKIQCRDPVMAHLKYMAYFYGENPENIKNLDKYVHVQDSLENLKDRKSSK